MKHAKVLFLVTEDYYFLSHRIAFGRALVAEGYDVAVGCRLSGKEDVIATAGIKVFPIPFARERLSPLAVLRACMAVRKLIATFAPDVVHLVALRPILVGWIATLGMRRPPFINAFTGLGSLFIGTAVSWRLRLARWVVRLLFRRVFRHSRAYNVFQNQDNLEDLVSRGLSPRSASLLIRGSGVDTDSWTPRPEPENDPPVVLFLSRLLRDKGVKELIDASLLLKNRNVPHQLRLVGDCDYCNPTSFTESEVRQWHAEGLVEWLGPRTDVLEQMSAANLVVLPSYGEGLPKVLLEAGVAERAVVTCDVPGCREIVLHRQNGLLVPCKNPQALADAIEELVRDPVMRRTFASRHRARVCAEFSQKIVHEQFLRLYAEILRTGRSAGRLTGEPRAA